VSLSWPRGSKPAHGRAPQPQHPWPSRLPGAGPASKTAIRATLSPSVHLRLMVIPIEPRAALRPGPAPPQQRPRWVSSANVLQRSRGAAGRITRAWRRRIKASRSRFQHGAPPVNRIVPKPRSTARPQAADARQAEQTQVVPGNSRRPPQSPPPQKNWTGQIATGLSDRRTTPGGRSEANPAGEARSAITTSSVCCRAPKPGAAVFGLAAQGAQSGRQWRYRSCKVGPAAPERKALV